MTKDIISSIRKKLLWLVILCWAGCSPIEATITPRSTVTPTDTPTSHSTTSPMLSPLTGKIAFVTYDAMNNNHINVMSADGSGLVDITPPNPPQKIEFLSWSPDGQYIAFDAWKDGRAHIFKIKLDGSGLVQLTFGDVGGGMPSWSPDGKTIMFASFDPDILDNGGTPTTQIYIVNSDGSNLHRFVVRTKPDNTAMTGSYRKDGLVAVEERITRYAVTNYVVDSDGVIQNQFPEFSTDLPVAWSPDGNFVAYAPGRRTPGCFGIVIMKFDGSNSSCLLDQEPESTVYFVQVSWSSDGKHIMFLSNLNGDYDLYAIQPDDSETTQLTNMPGHEDWAVWSPGP